MDKLGRNYLLQVNTPSGRIDIALPITIEFDIIRNTLPSLNKAQIRIYNLKKEKRDAMRHNFSDFFSYQQVILYAGYGSIVTKVFSGNITAAWSFREGVNFITQIECLSGGYTAANDLIEPGFGVFVSGNTYQQSIATLASRLSHTSIGAIGNFPGSLTRGNSYDDSIVSVLRQISGNAFHIDNEKVYALGTNEYLATNTAPPQISSSSGLLGTPLLETTTLRFDMLFEPSLYPNQLIFLKSDTESTFNQNYKIITLKHRGLISDAVCGDLITSVEMFYSQTDFSPVTPFQGGLPNEP